MGIGGMKPCGLWEIDIRPFNASLVEVDKLTVVDAATHEGRSYRARSRCR